jgi:CRP-like cAMP-binding protein
MVTHDNDMAQRVDRTIIIADGEIIEEHLIKIFPSFSQQQLIRASSDLKKERHSAGAVIIRQGGAVDRFYIVTGGDLEMTAETAGGTETIISRLGKGQYFGELGLLQGEVSPVSVRVVLDGKAELAYLTAADFKKLLDESESTRSEIEAASQQLMRKIKK